MTGANPLLELHPAGQSFWWDALSRRDLQNGEVARMRDENGMRGITSNPSIFQKALAEGEQYDEGVARLLREGRDREEIFWELAVEDIRAACEILHPVYDGSGGADGFVSLEVDPRLAHDTDSTLAEARRLDEWVDRPNLMIKIPGTPEGMPAVRQALREGIHVNVTLLFSQEAHRQTMEAYLEALEERREAGDDPGSVASVASFFVSRVDTLVDEKLEALDDADALALRGRAAVANARLAYQNFLETFSGPRWDELSAAGARVQRPLWASTSTKNPAYRDVIYVEELVGPHTVNTMPTATVEAFRDHGRVRPLAITEAQDEARETLDRIEALGISMESVTDQLLREGVRKFEESFEGLLDSLDAKTRRMSESGKV